MNLSASILPPSLHPKDETCLSLDSCMHSQTFLLTLHQTHSPLLPHMSVSLSPSSSAPAGGHSTADSLGDAHLGPDAPCCLSKYVAAVCKDACRVPASACLNVCTPLSRGLLQQCFPGGGVIHTASEAGWNMDAECVLLSFLLHLRGHLARSAFLTLNIHSPVKYDQGRVKEGHFVT